MSLGPLVAEKKDIAGTGAAINPTMELLPGGRAAGYLTTSTHVQMPAGRVHSGAAGFMVKAWYDDYQKVGFAQIPVGSAESGTLGDIEWTGVGKVAIAAVSLGTLDNYFTIAITLPSNQTGKTYHIEVYEWQ